MPSSRPPAKRRATPVTEAQRQQFLEELRGGKTLKEAAVAAGHPTDSFWNYIKKDPEFKAAKDAAMAEGADVIEAEVRRKVLEGSRKPIIGKVAPGIDGHLKDDEGNPMYEMVHHDRLAEFLLKARKPEYKDNPRIDINNKTLNVSIEDRSAALAEVYKVMQQAGVNIGEIVDGEATELSDSGASPHKELPGPSNLLAEPSEL